MPRWKVRAFIGPNELYVEDASPSEVFASTKTEAREKAVNQLNEAMITFDRLEVEELK